MGNWSFHVLDLKPCACSAAVRHATCCQEPHESHEADRVPAESESIKKPTSPSMKGEVGRRLIVSCSSRAETTKMGHKWDPRGGRLI